MTSLENIIHNFKGINDSTLREGEQYNSSQFSLADQKEILGWLNTIGVDTVEVGNPIVPEINHDIKELSQVAQRPPLMAHIRNNAKDLEAAIETKVEGVHVLCTADPERLGLMHQDLQQHTDKMTENVQYAQSKGLAVRVSVEHGLEERFFADALKILKTADNLNVDRVQVADTRGVLFPWDIENIMRTLRREIHSDIGVHLHGDLGHAVSNAMIALANGANWSDVTFMGIGERMGITPLSTLFANLSKVDGALVKKYSLSVLTSAEQRMAEIVHMTVPHNLITSPTAFSHKAGIHINGLEKQGSTIYEAIDPEIVGNQRVVVTGSRISGKKGLKRDQT